MTRCALNSAVPTAFGTCEYEPLNRTAAREWWEAGPVVATIGYEETCIAMERVLGIPRPRVNRKTIEMGPEEDPAARDMDPFARRGFARRIVGHLVQARLLFRRGERQPLPSAEDSRKRIIAEVERKRRERIGNASPRGSSSPRPTSKPRRRKSSRSRASPSSCACTAPKRPGIPAAR